jgi:hypothetical protein
MKEKLYTENKIPNTVITVDPRRRHRVMDLYCSDVNQETGEWKKIQDNLPISSDVSGVKVKVRLKNMTEMFAYFYTDLYPPTFWDCAKKEPLYDVVEWINLKEDTDNKSPLETDSRGDVS